MSQDITTVLALKYRNHTTLKYRNDTSSGVLFFIYLIMFWNYNNIYYKINIKKKLK